MYLLSSKVTCIINILRKLKDCFRTLPETISNMQFVIMCQPSLGLLSKIIFHLYRIRTRYFFNCYYLFVVLGMFCRFLLVVDTFLLWLCFDWRVLIDRLGGVQSV